MVGDQNLDHQNYNDNSEVLLMSGIRRLKWAMRKAHLPVGYDGLVLDVGSGGKPFPRADILLDRVSGAEHRQGNALVVDRPIVLGDACKMPFKDKSFDFVIASHILEHIPTPEIFLCELMRVGKAGYIETPNAVYERINPFSIHCLEVHNVGNKLVIHKKDSAVVDQYFDELSLLKKDTAWQEQMRSNPALFHTRLFWQEEIQFNIVNEDANCDWINRINQESKSDEVTCDSGTASGGWRRVGLTLISAFYRWRRSRRLKKFSLSSVLACPDCHGELTSRDNALDCSICSQSFKNDPFPDFTKGEKSEASAS